jgi:hypothetical protein
MRAVSRTFFLCLLMGCGSSEPSANNNDDAAVADSADTAIATDDGVTKRSIEAVLNDYVAAWMEADATKRMAKLEASVTKDVFYADLSPVTTKSITELSTLIGNAIKKYRGIRLKKLSGPDVHHDRMRFLWSMTDTTDAPIADGLDYIEISPIDGKIQRIVGHFDPAPKPTMLEPVMTSFTSAFTTTDAALRLDLLTKSLGGVYLDRTDGALDAAALAKKIDPSVAFTVDGFQEYDAGFRIAYTRGTAKGVFLGRRNMSGLISEVSAFEGDPPKP